MLRIAAVSSEIDATPTVASAVPRDGHPDLRDGYTNRLSRLVHILRDIYLLSRTVLLQRRHSGIKNEISGLARGGSNVEEGAGIYDISICGSLN